MFLQIHPQDNVAVALAGAAAGARVFPDQPAPVTTQPIPQKHKAALVPFETGDNIRMYGVTVAKATEAIPAGGLLTTENVTNATQEITATGKRIASETETVSGTFEAPTWQGYPRPDGQYGTANHWLVFPLVFCENRTVERLRELLEPYVSPPAPRYDPLNRLVAAYRDGATAEELSTLEVTPAPANAPESKSALFPNVTLRFLTHQAGCGGTRQDAEMLCRLLAGYVRNPNVAGATVLSLGCQNAEVSLFERATAGIEKPIHVIDHQAAGSQDALVAEALKKTFLGLVEANKIQRTTAPLSALTLGLECGGSDGFSGISANPVLGYVSDRIVAAGGRALLAEFPELAGVENELTARCRRPRDARRFLDLMKIYGQRARDHGSSFADNPSPGNIRDGLLTDAMKSAGAAKKGGTASVAAVLDFGEYAEETGLNLLCTPGNDVESTTGLAGSGANLIVFTTGLGTPTGNPVTPVVKVASNSELAKRMPDIIDFDTGPVIRGKASITELGEVLLARLLEYASGRATKAMVNRQYDFIPWKRGISL